ncbi:MAG: glycosyltransferase [Candidatus Cloacimonadaceae bacterium]|nr:glycosyltransferase [Candidatus Cloacimonadaceae bacterium]
MRILFLNSIGKKKYGGGEKWMIRASQELVKRGHTVFFGAKNGSVLLGKAADAGLQTWGIDIHADISPLATHRIVNFLKTNQIDVLICNLNKDVRVGGLAARIAGTPLVLARHGMLLCGRKTKHRLTLCNLTDGIITNTKSIKETYGTYGWFTEDFVKVLYNGVELVENIEPVDLHTQYPGKKIVLSAGRLAEQKGFDYLISAAATICKDRDDIIFLIAGEGKLEKQLQSMIAEH